MDPLVKPLIHGQIRKTKHFRTYNYCNLFTFLAILNLFPEYCTQFVGKTYTRWVFIICAGLLQKANDFAMSAISSLSNRLMLIEQLRAEFDELQLKFN